MTVKSKLASATPARAAEIQAEAAAMFPADGSNPWIASAAGAGRRLSPWIAVVLAAGAAVACIFVGGRLGAAIGAWAHPVRLIHNAIFQLFVFGPMLAFGFLAGSLEGRRVWLTGSPGGALLGLALGAGGFALVLVLAVMAGVVVPGAGEAVGAAAAGGVGLGLAMFSLQAAAEEVYFRGWLQPILCERWGPWPGLAVTAVLFAALHVAGGVRSPLALLNLTLGGLMFGLLALRSGGLWAPFLAHLAWNWIEACGVGLEPNPGLGATGALVDLDLRGAALWSGGPDDLNGSLATTLVLASIVIALAALFAPVRSAAPAARRSGFAPPQTT
jgi:membrane protease YdiL (CAAX protease family)